MPQAGSLSATSANTPAAFSYPNEWRMATARLNPGCTAASQEMAKFTLPNLPNSSAGCRCWEICRQRECQDRARGNEVRNACQSHFAPPRKEFPIPSPFPRKTICRPPFRVNLQSPWPQLRVRCGSVGGSADRSGLLPGSTLALPDGMTIPQRPVRCLSWIATRSAASPTQSDFC